ncbi:SDR family NAD(P)-dependent oxidoreductase [Rhodococcus sp. HNM0569]|nr:SDR family NAD(P)-dependent oxidoreductase [Rhodococcus sp. HNM0569]
MTSALVAAAEQLGPIEVLEYSPYAGLVTVSPQELTVELLRDQIDPILFGAVAAAQAVLPAMRRVGTGTLLFTIGGGALQPYPMMASTNTAQAALRNWVHNLHNTLAHEGIQAATVAVNLMIGATAPEGVPHRSPDALAEIYRHLHTSARDEAEVVVGS